MTISSIVTDTAMATTRYSVDGFSMPARLIIVVWLSGPKLRTHRFQPALMASQLKASLLINDTLPSGPPAAAAPAGPSA